MFIEEMGGINSRVYHLLFAVFAINFYCTGQPTSVLSGGQWAKLAVVSKGIYKIDFQTLRKSGFDPGSIQPGNIQLYGQGGGMLDQSNDVSRANDLVENAIYQVGLEDGSFDRNDYVLFYSEGPNLEYINREAHLVYQKNLYSDTAYYFLTVGTVEGKRLNSTTSLGTGYPEITSYPAYYYHEIDRENILSSGREWYGELITASNQVRVKFEDSPVLVPGSKLEITAGAVNRSNEAASFVISANGTEAGTIAAGGIGPGTYDEKGVVVKDTLVADGVQIDNKGNLELVISYQGPGRGLLDYLTVTFETPLSLDRQAIYFSSPESLANSASTYKIANSDQNTLIWDVTDPHNITLQKFQLVGGQAVFGVESDILRSFTAFSGDDFPVPSAVFPVSNQNLHGMEVPDMLIVTHATFLPQAERLAAFRALNDRLKVSVVTTNEIYNEFSSGRQDVTAIRDLVKHLYEKSDHLKYLLLFGRCSYDYKNVTEDNTNFVPTYQSRNSTDPIYSYNSDDYFGFLDQDEGVWSEELSGAGGHLLDISVGRLPVTTRSEAAAVVDKLIHYATNNSSNGSWRKDIYYVADDGDFNLHQRDADRLATMVDTANQDFNVNKIYMDAYPQEDTPNGESADAVNQALEETIKKGALIINYTGHGSEFRWAQETILSHNMINAWENMDRLPLFVTATCEFGRYDDPDRISGAEKLILNPKGGAIGLVTTARPVFASKNFILNQAFYEIALNRSITGYPTLGDIFKYIKNDSYQIVANRNFTLLGDPSMKLAYPRKQISITDILNDSIPGDTIKALSKVTLRGEVMDTDGSFLGGYHGTAEITVFDNPSTTETLGSEGGRTFTFEQRNNIVFRGQSTIKSGRFEVNFIVPKNINHEIGEEKISLYALSSNGLEDASGVSTSFFIGGNNKNPPEDNTPPQIALYMDDLSFTNGGSTDKNPVLLVRLTDESGINTLSTGSGQDITATLDSGQEFILNDFYKADPDSYQSGWVSYPLNNLKNGKQAVTLKVSDIYGNSSEAKLDFFVYDGASLNISELYNFPNPFNESTAFFIDHNQPGEDLEITVSIFDRQGKLVHQILTSYENSPSTIRDIIWNGTNGGGVRQEDGIYLYQVSVRSKTSGNKNVVNQKMILIK